MTSKEFWSILLLVMENKWWRQAAVRTDGSGEQMVLGLMAVKVGKTEAIRRRSLLL
jgi:hypothetical protein